jgi:hypothetical protein
MIGRSSTERPISRVSMRSSSTVVGVVVDRAGFATADEAGGVEGLVVTAGGAVAVTAVVVIEFESVPQPVIATASTARSPADPARFLEAAARLS